MPPAGWRKTVARSLKTEQTCLFVPRPPLLPYLTTRNVPVQLHLFSERKCPFLSFVRWKSDLFSLSDNTACLICWWKLLPGWLLVVCGEPKIKSAIFSHVASVTASGSPALMGCRDLSCQWPIPKKSNSLGHWNVYLSTCQKLSGDASCCIWTLNANTAVGCRAPIPDWHGWMLQTRTWELQTPYF